MLLVVGIGMNANAQQCSFVVTDVSSSISSATVTLTVTIVPTFTPNGSEIYEVVVRPTGELKGLLNSQSKSVVFYARSGKWSDNSKTVTFTCSVEDNSYRQCRNQDFSTTCFKK